MPDALPVEICGLVKRYGPIAAVDGLDLVVERGESVAVLGPNGAGKTTALRVLTCATPFDAGSVRVLGLDVRTRAREVKARIGLVTQEETLDVDLPVAANLEVFASYHRIPPAEARRRADRLLGAMGLRDRRDSEIADLSGGMRRRLAIARALVADPALLVLDEPTTGLDPHARHAVWDRIRRLQADGTTIVLTTHYLEEAARLADRVVVLDRGRRIAEGPPRDLVRAHAGAEVIEVRLDGAARARAAEVRARLAAADRLEEHGDVLLGFYDRPGAAAEVVGALGAGLDFVHRPATLEDVFLRLTGRGLES